MVKTDIKLNQMEIHLAHTQGFCAGVASAIEVVERALEKFGTPLYVRHHIVHNTSVIEDFEERGVIFIEELKEVPEGQNVIFSAHGTAPGVYEEAKLRDITVIDATCPLVTKVHREAVRFSERDVQTILIGHRGHQELIGTSGYVNQNLLHVIETVEDIDSLELDESKPIGFLTQTTLSIDDTKVIVSKLREKYPGIVGPPKSDICFATQNRQSAVAELTEFCDVIIICGSPHSSNSNRLKESAEKKGVTSYIIDVVDELDLTWIEGKQKIGISSGASVPRKIVDEVVKKIMKQYPEAKFFQEESVEKNIKFAIPKF